MRSCSNKRGENQEGEEEGGEEKRLNKGEEEEKKKQFVSYLFYIKLKSETFRLSRPLAVQIKDYSGALLLLSLHNRSIIHLTAVLVASLKHCIIIFKTILEN